MKSSERLKDILRTYDNEIAILYGKLLKIEKENLNNRIEGRVVENILKEIRGGLNDNN